ncbi:MAG: hypothetical protein HPY60_10775 [Candidatus Methanofastidiosum sp.]|nr:hypothetical protein [Methanofastidiosum sp.]
MKFIYLDQFATSNLFDSNEDSIWQDIKYNLKKGFEKGKIACPLSLEHLIESSKKESIKAISLHKEFLKLSQNLIFKPELFITSQLLISLVRGNNVTRNTYLEKFNDNSFFTVEQDIKLLLNKNETFINIINESTELLNNIRNSCRSNNSKQETKNLLVKKLKELNAEKICTRLYELIQNKKIFISSIKTKSGNIPSWIDLIIHQLLYSHRMNEKETKKLIIEINKNGFNNIPTLDIRFSLLAIICVFNKNENSNDHIDIMRISTGLPISDIFLTDFQRKNELEISGLAKKYNTKIFSGKKNDLVQLNDLLSRICE